MSKPVGSFFNTTYNYIRGQTSNNDSNPKAHSEDKRPNYLIPPPNFALLNKLPEEMTISILTFLDKKDLRYADILSKYFRPLVDACCQQESIRANIIPASLPSHINSKQFWLNLFPNAIGPEFIQGHLGSVENVPPVPRKFIEMTGRQDPASKSGELIKDNYRLVYIPETIMVRVDKNSPIVGLYHVGTEADRLAGKKTRLIEDPNKRQLEPSGIYVRLIVPVTLNNMLILSKYLKKGLPNRFHGAKGRQPVFDQNGDMGVGPSHWSYQRIRTAWNGTLGKDCLELVPLTERVLFQLFSYFQSGQPPQNDWMEGTSTPTRSPHSDHSWPSSVLWPAFDQDGINATDPLLWEAPHAFFRLSLDYASDYGYKGIAVKVSLENPEGEIASDVNFVDDHFG